MKRASSNLVGGARLHRAAIVLVGGLHTIGCRAAFDYPETRNESTSALCSNGTDDDFDGVIDCDDPSCDGYCPEQDIARCADGRDNDGDGLVDALDPRCWSTAGPTALRCASLEPVDFEERFDGVLSTKRWYPFGRDPGAAQPSVELIEPLDRDGRPDRVAGFIPVPDASLATGLSSRVLFDGDWRSFELAFQARVDGGQGIQVALAPGDMAPAGTAPREGALLASLALSVDGQGNVALVADGAKLDLANVSPEAWHHFRLNRDGERLALLVDGQGVHEDRAPGIAASRLVIWGDVQAQIDDVHLWIAGSHPCGVTGPQIPLGDGCAKDTSVFAGDVGETVSMARGKAGSFCALTTDGNGSEASSWRSPNGREWDRGGALTAASEGNAWLGAGIAWDAEQALWRAAVATRGPEGTNLQRLASTDCQTWSLDGSVPLPDGAHSPSYLLPGVVSRHELYFVSSPEPDQGPTVWRYRSDDGETFFDDGVPVVGFPLDAEMQSPLAITRAGPADVILTHRVAPETGTLGLGLWVAESDDLSSWRRASNHPLLQTVTNRGGFDGEAMVSAALHWDAESALALYGARGEPVWPLYASEPTSAIAVSTAALAAAGETTARAPFDQTPVAQLRPGSCGNGTCEDVESCTSCPIDCNVCDGAPVLFDAFDDAGQWTSEPTNQPSAYVSTLAERLSLGPGDPQWISRELPEVLSGDFEISFDVHWTLPEGAKPDERCVALVGVARGSEEELVADGVFVQLDQQLPCLPGRPSFSPYVRVGRSRYPSLEVRQQQKTCKGMLTGIGEAWHRVVLRRTGGKAYLQVSAGSDCLGEETGKAIATYAGPIDGFERVAVGWGRSGWTESCSTASASLSIDNVVVRALPCPEGGTACTDEASGGEVCVDVMSSPEHCGSCNARVEPGEHCEAGKVTCGGDLCPVGDSGAVVCTDLKTSPKHCGGCGQEVSPLEVCRDGIPVTTMVAVPGDYEVDATEVTMGQYEAWLATNPLVSDQHPLCSWNENFGSKCLGESLQSPRQPVTCINWCDAFAYCKGVGKRLCTGSEWARTCASGSAGYDYPYGAAYDPLACNGADSQYQGSPMPCAPMAEVGTKSTCQSDVEAYRGIFDLAGNAWEWVDNCVGEAGRLDTCDLVGGSHCDSGPYSPQCLDRYLRARENMVANVGFRCCR